MWFGEFCCVLQSANGAEMRNSWVKLGVTALRVKVVTQLCMVCRKARLIHFYTEPRQASQIKQLQCSATFRCSP